MNINPHIFLPHFITIHLNHFYLSAQRLTSVRGRGGGKGQHRRKRERQQVHVAGTQRDQLSMEGREMWQCRLKQRHKLDFFFIFNSY